MKTRFFKVSLSLVFIFGITLTTYAQQGNNSTFVEELFEIYSNQGIEKTLEAYKANPVSGDIYTYNSEPLNTLGYRIMGTGDLSAAEKVFLAQIDEYPEEANPYDSYADLLMQKGEEDKAVEFYKKAIDHSGTIEDAEQKAVMLETTQTKVALAEKTPQDLQFLKGKWNSKTYSFSNDEKRLVSEGEMIFAGNKNNSIINSEQYNKAGDYYGTRIIAYDAVDEEFDMAFIQDNMSGVRNSSLELVKSTPEQVIMTETFSEKGKTVNTKHVLNRKGENIEWLVYDLSDGNETLTSQTDLTQKN